MRPETPPEVGYFSILEYLPVSICHSKLETSTHLEQRGLFLAVESRLKWHLADPSDLKWRQIHPRSSCICLGSPGALMTRFCSTACPYKHGDQSDWRIRVLKIKTVILKKLPYSCYTELLETITKNSTPEWWLLSSRAFEASKNLKSTRPKITSRKVITRVLSF